MVQNKGINDMEKGWKRKNEYNLRVYTLWNGMLYRCYSESFHKKQNTYRECYVCDRWLKLSNFVEDIVKIDNYEYWLNNPNQKIALDKDIKSNGKNKCYCLSECLFVSQKENTEQSNKTRNNDYLQGNKNPNATFKIAKINPKTNEIIDVQYGYIYKEQGYSPAHICACCKFHEINCNKEEWFKKYKTRPCKQHKGYVWKYFKESE